MSTQSPSLFSWLNMPAHTLTNGSTGVLHFQAGGGGDRYFTGDLVNNGTVQVDQNTLFDKSGGVYTNNEQFIVSSSGALTITNGTLANFSGGVLTGGTYDIAGLFRFPGADISTNRAEVILRGASSQIVDNNTSGDALTNFATNDTPGIFRILDNRHFTAAGAFTNNGLMEIGGGTFDAASLDNAAGAQIFGYGTIVPRPTNHGHIRAAGGTLAFNDGIQGGSGTVEVDPAATLDLSGGMSESSADNLTLYNGGSLALGNHNFQVKSDYQNANSGTGNSFNHRAGVTGSGQINADPAVTQSLIGDVTNGNTASATMAFGNVHVGTSTTKNYDVRNSGSSGPSLRGAIQTAANGANITDGRLSGTGVTAGNFGPIAPGTNASGISVTFHATSAGALTGQKVHITNNFDNVGDQDLAITGAAYRLASPTTHAPEPVNFGILHVGDPAPSQALSVTNNATNDGFSEKLNASIGSITPTGGVSTNGGTFMGLAPGSTNNTSLSVGIDTSTAGVKNGTATISLTSDGAGTSGLGLTSLSSQTVNVIGTVNNYAVAQVLKLSGGGTLTMTAPDTFSLDFGTFLETPGTISTVLGVKNDVAAPSDSLSGSFMTTPGGYSLSGFSGFSNLAAGSTQGGLNVQLNSGVAGTYTGSITLSPQSVNPTPFTLNLAPITIHLSATILLPGDFNLDNKVDAADYVMWRKLSGVEANYDAWRKNFGRVVGGGGSIEAGGASAAGDGAVPEPAALVVALLGLAIAGVVRRR
jgi:hypothetical protein